jgi:sugar lactone lactonase YvrE
MMRQVVRAALLTAACLAALAAPAAAQCEPDGDVEFVCGPISPEDLIAIPDSPWVVVASMVDDGYLSAADSRDHRTVRLFPAESAPSSARHDTAMYSSCPGVTTEQFRAHGISLRPGDGDLHTLYVVRHGEREAVEVFEVDARGETPALTWIGCAVAPEGATLNAVVALPGGGFATTAPRMEGEVGSGIWEWHTDTGWALVPGSEDIRPNGLEVSADGEWLYVAGWQDERFIRLSRGRTPVEMDVLQIGFRPDNLRMAPDGRIYAAGHTDFQTPDEASNVAWIDPETLEFERIFHHPYMEGFAATTTAMPIGGDIWLGTNRGEMIAYFPAP